MRKNIYFGMFGLCLFIGCLRSNVEQLPCCRGEKIILKSVFDIDAEVRWWELNNAYYLALPEINKKQQMAIPCNLPDNFRKHKLKVKFSGSLIKLNKNQKTFIGNIDIFGLELSKIENKVE